MHERLIRIAERASTLDERLEGIVASDCAKPDEGRKQFRLQQWKQTATNGSDSTFRKRLQIDHMTPRAAERIVCSARIRDPRNLPPWTQTLARLIDSAKFIDRGEPEKRIPFEQALWPFVQSAGETLRERSIADIGLLSDKALAALERTLLNRLSMICSRPLALELNVARLLGTLHGETPQERYQDFIRNQIASPKGMLDFFSEYSAAGRLVAVVVDQWIDSTTELLSRLQQDLPAIQADFAGGQDPGMVVEIVDHLSDPHNHGRTTKQLTFASGLKIIYKPKNLAIDAAFQNLLESINAQKKLLPLKTFQILNRDTHGWVEFLSSRSCRNPEEVDRYFLRAGMLLCLLHALGGSDCHNENLFACGEHPVMIDLETLLELQPDLEPQDARNADQLAQESCRMSLLYTGMLPRLVFGDAGAKGVDFSALAGRSAQLPFRSPVWIKNETDEMQLELTYETFLRGVNRPMLNEGEVSTLAYREKLEEGFREMYRFLIQSRHDLMKNRVLEDLCAAEVRYLNRSTAEYYLILQKSLDPAFLKEGIDRSIFMETLFRKLIFYNEESFWKLVKAERGAMERLDVPYFTAGARDTVLLSDRQEPVSDFAMKPAAGRLADRIMRLSEEELDRQMLFLRATWAMHAGSSAIHRSDDKLNPPLLNKEELVRAAAKIGESLKASAIRSKDGSVTWIGADFVPDLNQFSIAPCGSSLYSGKFGIALFLAALHRFVPDRGYADLASGALQTVRRILLGEKAQSYIGLTGIGAMSGAGSICWCLLRIGELLQKQDLIEDAGRVGVSITQYGIRGDRYLDVIGGSAGAILSLLALYRSLPESVFLTGAEQFGKHLLKQSVDVAPGSRAWPTVTGERLTGYAHGASGFAHALFRLYEATQKDEYRTAALQAFAYESSLFSREHQNWPDLRKDISEGTDSTFMVGWCHGAPGITLARVASLAYIDPLQFKDEIEAGLDTTLKAPIVSQDDLCCGNFSRVETLLLASEYLERPDLRNAALERASIITHFASKEGAFSLHPGIRDGLINPGFMKGIAGIGYSLLRIADPQYSLPSPLLM